VEREQVTLVQYPNVSHALGFLISIQFTKPGIADAKEMRDFVQHGSPNLLLERKVVREITQKRPTKNNNRIWQKRANTMAFS
jgi:hypothetical protein